MYSSYIFNWDFNWNPAYSGQKYINRFFERIQCLALRFLVLANATTTNGGSSAHKGNTQRESRDWRGCINKSGWIKSCSTNNHGESCSQFSCIFYVRYRPEHRGAKKTVEVFKTKLNKCIHQHKQYRNVHLVFNEIESIAAKNYMHFIIFYFIMLMVELFSLTKCKQ